MPLQRAFVGDASSDSQLATLASTMKKKIYKSVSPVACDNRKSLLAGTEGRSGHIQSERSVYGRFSRCPTLEARNRHVSRALQTPSHQLHAGPPNATMTPKKQLREMQERLVHCTQLIQPWTPVECKDRANGLAVNEAGWKGRANFRSYRRHACRFSFLAVLRFNQR